MFVGIRIFAKVTFSISESMLYMNPGAIGQHGFHIMLTLLLFDLRGTDLKISVVVLEWVKGRNRTGQKPLLSKAWLSLD